MIASSALYTPTYIVNLDFTSDCIRDLLNIKAHIMASLPPLPKSLQGVLDETEERLLNPCEDKVDPENKSDEESNHRHSGIEDKLDTLRSEMLSLREQDKSLYSQLCSLNERLQDLKLAMNDRSDTVSESSSYYDLNLDTVIPTIEEHEYENEEFHSKHQYENAEIAEEKEREEKDADNYYEPVYIGLDKTKVKNVS